MAGTLRLRRAMADERPILTGVEEKAREGLGVERWDRPSIFRETASAATDSTLPYWLVLLLSGGIATLGLALDSSAVVIGAMLIAPLLAPVVGLALALAVGDGRLALQTAAMVLASTLGVILTAAMLTSILPYQELTSEISARTRPTTLDLVIAVFSGLAGVIVTVARGQRLSAAIPGVAISVALIPPLAVSGFGVGIGWDWTLIRGSLLLYGANLAGIVLSGMLVFILVGMHRADVIEAARRWHRQERPTGLLARLDHFSWVRSLGVIRSTWSRVGLVSGFAVSLAMPLHRTMEEITREVRVRSAVTATVNDLFELQGQSSVLSQQLVSTREGTQVFLRVATATWLGDEVRERFAREASTRAGEPVHLVLEQLPASRGDIEQLAELIPARSAGAGILPSAPSPVRIPDLLSSLRERLEQAAEALALPDGIILAGMDVSVNGGQGGSLRLAYLAAEPLPASTEQVLSRQFARSIGDPSLRVDLVHVSSRLRGLDDSMDPVVEALRRFHALRVEVAAAADQSRALEAIVSELVDAGIDRGRIDALVGPEHEPGVRLQVGASPAPIRVPTSQSSGAPRPPP